MTSFIFGCIVVALFVTIGYLFFSPMAWALKHEKDLDSAKKNVSKIGRAS